MPVEVPAVCATEQAYYDLWMASVDRELPATTIAEAGARLADRAAWVFVGAYQGAMRQAYPQLRGREGWASYLVSEARDDSKSPTCVLESNGADFLLSGRKNWVAARAHLSWLVVNPTAADGTTEDVLLAADQPGVALIEKPSGKFLPELNVGRAEFADVAVQADQLLPRDQTHADLFGLIEARCLLVALAAHFAAVVPQADGPAQSLALSRGLVTAELGQRGSIAMLLESMDVLVEWFTDWISTNSNGSVPGDADQIADPVDAIRRRWADDQRLLQMHRPLLTKRLKST